MKSELEYIKIVDFTTEQGANYDTLMLSYQLFGRPLATAPVVLINHALTGNSNVCGVDGWWKDLIGENKCIDTNLYTVLAFNIPGNGFENEQQQFLDNYKDFVARDIARIFRLGLQELNISALFAVIGGSVGGGIAWEMAGLYPKFIQHVIPIAADWKSTDWLIANCLLQDNILNNSCNPIEDARIHAMLCYRTPQSLKGKFNRTVNERLNMFNIESWLLHHGKKLKDRFQLSAYKLINQLLKSIDISRGFESFEEIAVLLESHIHIVAVDSDLFFTANESRETHSKLKTLNVKTSYYEIKSIHGHDAFLIEYDQLSNLLKPIFENQTIKVA